MDPVLELVYFIDRTLTAKLKALSQLIEQRLRLNLSWQGAFLGGSSALISQHIPSYLHIRYDLLSTTIGLLFVIISSTFIINTVAWLLEQFHRFLDYEGAISRDKLYDNGSRAWGMVLISTIFVVASLIVKQSFIGGAFLFAGFVGLAVTYSIFVLRRKGNTKKRESYATEAIMRLLQRCRGWLKPLPQPG